MSKRAIRRAHQIRMKNKAVRYMKQSNNRVDHFEDYSFHVKKRANHLATCSCWMCGNPRKYHKDYKTIQEKIIDIYDPNE